jgi:hypothetical protein
MLLFLMLSLLCFRFWASVHSDDIRACHTLDNEILITFIDAIASRTWRAGRRRLRKLIGQHLTAAVDAFTEPFVFRFCFNHASFDHSYRHCCAPVSGRLQSHRDRSPQCPHFVTSHRPCRIVLFASRIDSALSSRTLSLLPAIVPNCMTFFVLIVSPILASLIVVPFRDPS